MVTISICLFTTRVSAGVDADWILSRADLALMESKKNGRNRTTIGKLEGGA
ncbi:MAG: hypothetical protein IAF58_12300 [Leptolyngbya sp.]|nr:hypothetical protein [Candidatus Melainabacteria bacterium]